MRRWRHGFAARQLRARPLAAFSVMFLLGLIAEDRLRPGLALCLALFGAGIAALTAMLVARKRAAWLILLLGLLAGMTRMSAAIDAYPPVDTRYSAKMTGRVVSDPFTNPDTGRVISRFLVEEANGEPEHLYVRLYLRGDAEALGEIAYGQRLSLTGHIWANDPVTNPYQFDFGQYLHRNGMSVISTAKIEDVEILETVRDAKSVVYDIRHTVAERIDGMFPKSAAMVRALVLGDRSLLSEESREALNATGTAHLISISGLHVTLLAMAVAGLLQLFMSRRRANLLTLVPLVFYGILIGFNAPFARALMMFAIFSFGPIAGLPSDPITRLCTAMLVYLVIKPLAILDGGFVLSFAASAGIILLMPPLTALFHLQPVLNARPSAKPMRRLGQRIASYFATLVCASIAAQLATLPAVVALFGVQSVVALPFNLICVPLCMAGYILSVIALLIGAVFAPLATPFAFAADGLLHALTAITHFSRRLPVTSVHIGRYPAILVAAHVGVILAASNLSRLRERVRRFLPIALLAVAAISSLYTWSLSWPFSVTFLDAGSADCAVARFDGKTYLFDVGDTYTPAADYLSATCLHLDGVILSHPHQDHAGGLTDILTVFRPDVIYVPVGWFEREGVSEAVIEGVETAMDMGIPFVELSTGDSVRLSRQAVMTVYSPEADVAISEVNNMSLLTLLTRRDRSVLFTGDLLISGEPDVVPECDILKVAHHGADNATSYDFLASAVPEYAVICVGENSHGHPGEDALERLEASGAAILRTDRLGAITFRLSGDSWRIKTFLEASNEVE